MAGSLKCLTAADQLAQAAAINSRPNLVKAIIFDVDGTLIESMAIDAELYLSAINTVLGPVELRPSLNDYDNVTDSGIVAQLIDDNALSVESNVVDSIRAHFIEGLENHIRTAGPFPVIDGAPQVIDQLARSTQVRVAIATGGWRDSTLLKLESAGFMLDGIPVVTCDESPSRTEIMLTALSRLGDRFDSVTYFGDAEWDRRACRSLGWDFVAVGSELGGIDSYDSIEL